MNTTHNGTPKRIIVAVATVLIGIIGIGQAAGAATWSPYLPEYSRNVGGCTYTYGIVLDETAADNVWGIFVGASTTKCNTTKYRIYEQVRLKWVPTYANGNRNTNFDIRYSDWQRRTRYNSRGDAASDILTSAPRACGLGRWYIEGSVSVTNTNGATPSTYVMPANLLVPGTQGTLSFNTPCQGPNN